MSQLNVAFPKRDTARDGAIGDADHASRSSDHNPWVTDGNMGVVTAQDIDEDLNAPGHALMQLVKSICASRDKRVKYIIYEGQITVQGSDLQQWKKYTGSKNMHTVHAHISVKSDKKYYDDDSPWSIGVSSRPIALSETSEVPVVEPPAVIQPEKSESIKSAPDPQQSRQDQAQPPTSEAAGFTPEKFNAFVPQIDSAKAWIKRATAGTVLGSVLAYVGNLPQWLQIGLFSLLIIIVIGAVVMLVKYHSEIFAYVTKMNTLRATDGTNDPVIVGKPPTD